MEPQVIDYEEEIELIRLQSDTAAPEPKVTNITTNNNVISIAAEHWNVITWISDGKVIHQGPSIDLAANMDQIGAYVRAEIWGEDVMLYTQPFLLRYNGMPQGRPVHRNFRDSGRNDLVQRTVEYPYYWVTERLHRMMPNAMDWLHGIGIFRFFNWLVSGFSWFVVNMILWPLR
jgi:hypothetical protein